MSTMNISGVLTPAQPLDADICDNFYQALQQSAPWVILEGDNRFTSKGTIEIDWALKITDVSEGVRSFFADLKTMLQQEVISELGLGGVLILAADTEIEPFLMRVNVRDGKMFFQDGHIRWNPETPY